MILLVAGGTIARMNDWLIGFPTKLQDNCLRTAEQVRAMEHGSEMWIIAGTSIPGLVMASKLARAAQLRKDVTVVLITGKPPEPKRLINGCTLRTSTMRRLAHEVGTFPTSEIAAMHFRQLLGGTSGSFRQIDIQWANDSRGTIEWGTKIGNRLDYSVATSVRHGAILESIRALFPDDLALKIIAAEIPNDAKYQTDSLPLRFADGSEGRLPLSERHVVFNATPNSKLLRPESAGHQTDAWVGVVQVALHADQTPRCGNDVGLAPMIRRTQSAVPDQLAFVTPFFDPSAPEANWYAINTTIHRGPALDETTKQSMLDCLDRELNRIVDSLGLSIVDGAAKTARAVVPAYLGTAQSRGVDVSNDIPVVDAHSSFSSGFPAVNTDGMLAGVVGSSTYADAFSASTDRDLRSRARDAFRASDNALASVRWWNKFNCWTYLLSPMWLRTAVVALPNASFKNTLRSWTHLGDPPTHAS